ncbi:helix-turn-helix domain-containing protein [Streptomyces sp. WMMC500]|uniref:helix-turn-helix domain-containing protein n=1 Tax=Streptomyces sp. WMMC500 TaxID=3015154 RepID=UPI00248BAC7B|nr:helix-turn-helix domain-containing protein [Streptomyces sp. WMMC500]WBB58430.1 helix-turn-helix domain-containing protein [Streptomyces sp. WMMC500]
MSVTCKGNEDLRQEARIIEIGAARIWLMTLRMKREKSTCGLTVPADPELFRLVLSLKGAIGIRQDGRETPIVPGEMCIIDTSIPWDCVVEADSVTKAICLEIPKNTLSLQTDQSALTLAGRISGKAGVGALLARFLSTLAEESDTFREHDGLRLGRAVTDLTSATLVHHLDAQDEHPPENRAQVLTRRIRAFIHRRLHDPELAPPLIAAAHHISVSYLHRLFQVEGDTVSGWIRHQRLERARSDLADSALGHLPIHRVGARVGFVEPAVFVRTFRSTYGVTPGEYRRRALSQA